MFHGINTSRTEAAMLGLAFIALLIAFALFALGFNGIAGAVAALAWLGLGGFLFSKGKPLGPESN
jgi:hypothetical protein